VKKFTHKFISQYKKEYSPKKTILKLQTQFYLLILILPVEEEKLSSVLLVTILKWDKSNFK